MPSDAATSTGLLALPNDDPRKILSVALLLCLVCSIMVSGAAVLLRPLQERNQALSIQREIVKVSGLQGDDIAQLFEKIETLMVNLDTGKYAENIDPATYDAREAARDPEISMVLDADDDTAGIKRRPNFAPVYLVRRDGRIERIILPVYGKGLWSTMYGFLALAGDGRTIRALTFYEQAETPGLGDGIVNPQWQRQFEGKLALDESGRPRIRLLKGTVDPASPESRYQVDGLSGATMTSNGVTHLLQFWLGERGFGSFLKKLRSAGGHV